MKKMAAILAMSLAAFSCATTGDDPRRAGRSMRAQAPPGDSAVTLVSFLPAGSWWLDTRYEGRLLLSADQKSRLDALATSQLPDIEQARRKAREEEADFRVLLNTDGVTAADLERASSRVRVARERLTDQELRHVADVRLILSHAQWETLQFELQRLRQETRSRQGGRGGNPGGRRGRNRGRGGFGFLR